MLSANQYNVSVDFPIQTSNVKSEMVNKSLVDLYKIIVFDKFQLTLQIGYCAILNIIEVLRFY